MLSHVGIVIALSAPIGTAVFDPLADVVSVQSILFLAGIATIAVTIAAVLVPSGRAAIVAARSMRPDAG